MPREYTYPARIISVELAEHKSGTGYDTNPAKGRDEETERMIVNVEFPNGSGDRFNVGGNHRAEFIVGRDVQVVLRFPDVEQKAASG